MNITILPNPPYFGNENIMTFKIRHFKLGTQFYGKVVFFFYKWKCISSPSSLFIFYSTIASSLNKLHIKAKTLPWVYYMSQAEQTVNVDQHRSREPRGVENITLILHVRFLIFDVNFCTDIKGTATNLLCFVYWRKTCNSLHPKTNSNYVQITFYSQKFNLICEKKNINFPK